MARAERIRLALVTAIGCIRECSHRAKETDNTTAYLKLDAAAITIIGYVAGEYGVETDLIERMIHDQLSLRRSSSNS